MAIKITNAARSARAQGLVDEIGASPILRIYDNSVPAGPSSSLGSAVMLAEMELPSTWASVTNGVISKVGDWEDLLANAPGTATFFRIYKADGTTAILQGTCGTSSADMILDTVTFVEDAEVTITACTITDGNAE